MRVHRNSFFHVGISATILARKLIDFIVSDSNFADKMEQIRPWITSRMAKPRSPLQMAKLLLDIGEVCHEDDWPIIMSTFLSIISISENSS